jgi:hypothetical protein
MTEAVVNLVFLGLMIVAVIVCVLAPVAAIGFLLWNWRQGPIGTSRLLRTTDGRQKEL